MSRRKAPTEAKPSSKAKPPKFAGKTNRARNASARAGTAAQHQHHNA